MKLMIVVNVDWFFFSHRLPIALEALRRGHNVHIATTFTDSLYSQKLASYGFIIHPLSLDRSGANLSAFFRNFYLLYRLFRVVRPDILHLVTIQPILLGGLAAQFAGIKRCVFAISGLGHIFYADSFFSRIRRFIVKFFYKISVRSEQRAVIFQNSNDLSILSKVCSLSSCETYLINGSGVDISLFNITCLPHEPVVLMACRLIETKGVRDFVTASQLLKDRGFDARFVLAGAPDFSNPAAISMEQLRVWGEAGHVELLGHSSDISLLLSRCQVFCLPSFYPEGLPKVLCEAAAAGRPVVTTDEPGCRDAIENGVTGILVPSRDPASLADALEYLLSNYHVATSMGKAARSRAEDCFDINIIVRSHLNIYANLLASSNP